MKQENDGTEKVATALPPDAGTTRSLFTIGVSDKHGREIEPNDQGFSDPNAREARGLVFDLHIYQDKKGPQATAADMALYRDLARVEHALQELYPPADASSESRFRPYFVRLFCLAQLVLEGDVSQESKRKIVGGRLSTEVAKLEVAAIANDLIDDEASRVKNGHLRDLWRWAWRLALPFLAAYVVLMLAQTAPSESNGFAQWLGRLSIKPVVAANFMLLWVGTFVGVCLSYAIRTHAFSLGDLTRTDSDYLAPEVRLVLAGSFAMVLTLLAITGLGDLELGKVKFSDLGVQSMPTLAFVVGAVLGISEQKLSGTVEKRVGDLFGRVSPAK